MRWVYSLLLYLAAPFLLLRLLWQGDDRRRVAERFGRVPASATGVDTWVHAVSVGEVMAALPLIRALAARGKVLVTTTTPTGSARVHELLGDSVAHCYAPYDLPGAVQRFLDGARPRRIVIMETELWPNLFAAVRERSLPLLIANGRISPRSFPRYRMFRAAVSNVLADCTLVAAQGPADAQRFRELGAAADRVRVMGNLKFDFELDAEQEQRGRDLRVRLGTARPVWIAASTHEGEEQAALDAHQQLQERFPEAALILVPRHPQRFEAAARCARDSGLTMIRRSELGDWAASRGAIDAAVLLGDSMGEMTAYFAAADVAFVGGSLARIGGHNILEPAALGVPVLFGPHMFNFESARDLLLGQGAALEVEVAAALAPAIANLFADVGRREAMGAAGRAAVAGNRGALHRFLELLDSVAP